MLSGQIFVSYSKIGLKTHFKRPESGKKLNVGKCSNRMKQRENGIFYIQSGKTQLFIKIST